jgi:predicted ATPase/transcriptional regulator with XRE-family HTH domain
MNGDPQFGNWLKGCRKARDLSQAELATRVGCSAQTIEKIEAGTRRPSAQLATLLAGALDLAPAEQSAFIAWARTSTPPPAQGAPNGDRNLPSRPPEGRPALPLPPNPFIGRTQPRAALLTILRQPDLRLVTLTGPPGVGKTRLALQVAHACQGEFADGATFVALAAVHDPDLVVPTLLSALAVAPGREATAQESLHEALREKRMLLLLDNFEQVREAAPLLSPLLAAAPGLVLLLTSRWPLGLYGEHEFPVPPLDLPAPGACPPLPTLVQTEALALFAERAGAARPGFTLDASNAAVVATICARLDGLPLAIELAAARCKWFAPAQLQSQLQQAALDLRGSGLDALPRQHSLQASIAWSFDLLTPTQQAVFARLAVFDGGATLPAIAAVCAGVGSGPPGGEATAPIHAALEALQEGSLIQQSADLMGGIRVTLLETLREYAGRQLEAQGARSAAPAHHAAYYLRLAETAYPHLSGGQPEDWGTRLQADEANLRAALAWIGNHGTPEEAARFAARLAPYWERRGQLSEGRAWLERSLQQADALPLPLQAQTFHAAGILAYDQTDWSRAQTCYAEALRIQRILGDKGRSAGLLNNLGTCAMLQGDYAQARAWLEESLALKRAMGDRQGCIWPLNNLGNLAYDLGESEPALLLYEESLALCNETNNQHVRAIILDNMGEAWRASGDLARAAALHQASLALRQALGDHQGIALARGNLGQVALAQGEWATACARFGESLTQCRDLGYQQGVVDALIGLAVVAAHLGQGVRAAHWFAAADALLHRLLVRRYPVVQALWEQQITKAQEGVASDLWHAAWAAGEVMPIPEAIAEALAFVATAIEQAARV